MIGTTLGRYRIVAKLGEGGMGSVWRAEDGLLGRPVALKFLGTHLADSAAARERFVREARVASMLVHPGIATVYDAGEADGAVWIASRFVDGESVTTHCNTGPLPIHETVTIARETAAALAHAHVNGLVHRDVTAGNIMVTRDGHAVLVDFGLARPATATRLTSTGAVLGTVGYLAPEVLRGEPSDPRSDQYGLGAVLYKMLTGRLPFDGGPPEAILYRVLNEPVPPPSEVRPEIPPKLEHVVLKLLAREPADRYRSAEEAEAALAESVGAAGPSPSELRKRALARRWRDWSGTLRRLGRARVGMASLATLALFASATWFAAQRGWLPGTQHAPPVIAVLPFENTSADLEETAYLSEGLGVELTSRLGRGIGYRVLPWITSRRHGAAGAELRGVARDLRADLLLVGTFQSSDDRLRVSASLVDGRSGLQKWSRSFDEPVTDLLAVQTQVALDVATKIEGTLQDDEGLALRRQPTADPDAYSHYLKGVSFLQSEDFGTRMLALPFFERAIQLDSTLAEAYVGRGAAILDRQFRGTSGGIEALIRSRDSFQHALRLDPQLIQGERGLVSVAFEMGKPEQAMQIAARVARRGDSDVEGLTTRGWACVLSGFAESSIPLFDRVLELDPANQEVAWYRVVGLAWSEQYEECVEHGKEYIRKFGEDPEVYLWIAMSLMRLERSSRADVEVFLDRALTLFGDTNSNLYSIQYAAQYWLREGRPVAARELIDKWVPNLRQRLELSPDNYRILGVLAGLEGLAGERELVGTRVDAYVARIMSSKVADNPKNLCFALMGAASLEDVRLTQQIIHAIRLGDLANMGNVWDPYMAPRAQAFVKSSPEYQQLLADIRARVQELGKRYLRDVELKPIEARERRSS